MNFLAHLYLSGSDKEIKLGNFIADAIKGRDYTYFPAMVQKGILMHRDIDSFTDLHPVVKSGKMRLNGIYHKHSGIVMDIFYDHFLAAGWELYSAQPLAQFVKEAYIILASHYIILPVTVKKRLPFMIINNWLKSYESLTGIKSILRRMSQFTSLPDGTELAMQELERNYEIFGNEFREFFNELIQYVKLQHQVDIPKPGELQNANWK